MAPVTADAPAGPGAERWHFPPIAADVHLHHARSRPARTTRVPRRARRHPAGHLLPRSRWPQYLDPDEIFVVTKQGFDFFHEQFGVRYPFGKYDQLFVPEFNAGAMENAGCVTFLEDYIFRSRVTDFEREPRAETILHEMAHMWFGDLVTMRWWDDLWLNESFATWAAALVAQAEATRLTDAWTTFCQTAQDLGATGRTSCPPPTRSRPTSPDIEAVEVNFDGITYAKGASVLKQLVAYVGRDDFLAGLRAYFAEHAWGNATLDDLLGALEARRPAGTWPSWSKQWLETAGVNTLRPEFEIGADGAYSRRSPCCRRRRRATRRCARTGSRSASTTGRDQGLVRRAPGRDRRRRRAHRGPRAGRRAPAPTWCWSTTTT